MKYRTIITICLLCLAITQVMGSSGAKAISANNASAIAAYTTMLTNAPAMLGQYYIAGTSGTLGTLGETLASQSILNSWLRDTGNWVSLSPRVGRQGLDHIFIQTDANGMPRGLLVGESKYGHSQLGMTRDGIQMGSNWTNKRLVAMGNRYMKLASVTKLAKAPAIGDHHEMKVVLKNGKEVCFWRKNSQDGWKFSGSEEELAEAQKLAKAYGDYLKNAGEGVFAYRNRIFQIQPDGDDILITIRDASDVDNLKTIAKLPKQTTIRLADAMNQKVDSAAIAAELKKKLPHLSDEEIKMYADDLCSNLKDLTQTVSKWKIAGQLAARAGIATGAVVGIDVLLQLINEGEINFGRTAITGGAVFVGTVTGQALNLGLNHWKWSQNMLKMLGSKLGCSVSMISSATSSAVGGVFVSALLSYGLYFLGDSNIDTANLSFVSGSVGTFAGMAAGFATMSFATAVGTASTGTAISSLSGAAANSAALAWLGGGAVSAGGGGTCVGVCVVGGVVIVAAVAASYAVYAIYDTVIEYKDNKRIQSLLDYLIKAPDEKWRQMLENYHMN